MTKEELRVRTLKLMFCAHHDGPPRRIGNMTAGEKGIMGYLHRTYPEPHYSGDLAVQLKVGTGRIGNALKSLEAKNYIQREADEQDKRRILVSLTKEGYEMISSQTKMMERVLDSIIEEFGVERYEKFLHECEDIFRIGEAIAKKEGLEKHD